MSNVNPSKEAARNAGRGWAADAVMAWLPCLIGFVSVPLAILLPNRIEFENDVSLIGPFLALAALSLALLTALARFGPRWTRQLFPAMFLIGVFILLSDVFAPMQWGLLDGESTLSEPWRASLIEGALFAVLVVCWVKVPRKVLRAIGVAATVAVLASQALTLGFAASEGMWEAHAVPDRATSRRPVDGSSHRGNVYHIVFDSYGGLSFLHAVQRLELSEAFSGFTFFEQTLANYHITDASVPSFLQGVFYRGGSFREWQRGAREQGLRKVLEDAGYEIEVYSPDRSRSWMYEGASLIRTSSEISRSYFRGSDALRLVRVSIVRLAPNLLRKEARALSERLFGHVVTFGNDVENPGAFSEYWFYKRLSVPLVREFLDAEPSRNARGRYVYLHVMLPHSPSVWDKDCTYVASTTSFRAQTLCATRLMGEIVEMLKNLGRYDSSLVIFQSDHGYHGPAGGGSNLAVAPRRVKKTVTNATMSYHEIGGYFRRLHPLLAIKPAAADDQPMKTSAAPAQLIDVPATVFDLLEIEAPATDGESVFTLSETEPREIHLYAGVYSRDVDGKALILGQTISETDLAHISYTRGKGWKIYPSLRARAE